MSVHLTATHHSPKFSHNEDSSTGSLGRLSTSARVAATALTALTLPRHCSKKLSKEAELGAGAAAEPPNDGNSLSAWTAMTSKKASSMSMRSPTGCPAPPDALRTGVGRCLTGRDDVLTAAAVDASSALKATATACVLSDSSGCTEGAAALAAATAASAFPSYLLRHSSTRASLLREASGIGA